MDGFELYLGICIVQIEVLKVVLVGERAEAEVISKGEKKGTGDVLGKVSRKNGGSGGLVRGSDLFT